MAIFVLNTPTSRLANPFADELFANLLHGYPYQQSPWAEFQDAFEQPSRRATQGRCSTAQGNRCSTARARCCPQVNDEKAKRPSTASESEPCPFQLFRDILSGGIFNHPVENKSGAAADQKPAAQTKPNEEPVSQPEPNEKVDETQNAVTTSPTKQAVAKQQQNTKEIVIDVHQFKPENVVVKLVDNRLVVEAEQEQRENGLYTKLQLHREFELGHNFDQSRVQCLYKKDGQLTIEIPRVQPEQQKMEVVLPIQTEQHQLTEQEEEATQSVEMESNDISSSATEELETLQSDEKTKLMDEDLD